MTTSIFALLILIIPLVFQGCGLNVKHKLGGNRGGESEAQSEVIAPKDSKPLFEKNSEITKEQLAADSSLSQGRVEPKTTLKGATIKSPDMKVATLKGNEFEKIELVNACMQGMAKFPGKYDRKLLKQMCKDVEILDSCVSRGGQPIYHYNRPSRRKQGKAERILTFAVTHGDEIASGAVARSWANRLSRISPRNEWRVIPVLNPDGFDKRTRTNGAGVDVNRNYPSKDWDELALKWWKSKKKEDPRRYPGPYAGSEPETICSIDHINDFQPDLIISIHTPLGVLDFDGPRLNFPQFSNLPWISLGTYPGSLGRYMWHDRHVPVLTIELKNNVREALSKFDRLQDISGQVALTISNSEKKKK